MQAPETLYDSPSSPESQYPGTEVAELEGSVLWALRDDYNKGAAWDENTKTMTVTVFTGGTQLSDRIIKDYQERVAAILNNDASVVIVIDLGDPPAFDDLA